MGSSEKSLIVKKEAGTVIAYFNRPDKLNALNKDLFDEIERFIDVVETDKQVRCVVFSGTGEKAFCVGADLKERQGMTEKSILARFDFVHKLYMRIENLPFPTIAAINGVALGGGLEFALACDLRVAAETAVIGLPEVDLAIIPGNGGTQRLARIVGLARALELILLAKKMTAKQALDYGVIHYMVAPLQCVNMAKQWAYKIQEAGPLALKQAKKAIRQGLEKPLKEALSFEVDCYKPLIASKDRVEGMEAFLEKRKAQYQGL
jgi:enoyl-CoA hydratase/carnithine racemase